MRNKITFIGANDWARLLSGGLNARFPQAVECTALTIDGRAKTYVHTIRRLLSDDTVVRVGFPPGIIPDYNEDHRVRRNDIREQLKRMLFRTSVGQSIRKMVLFVRLPSDARQCLVIDWMQRASRWCRPHRREILYWIGTDVTNACDVLSDPRRSASYARRIRAFESITGTALLATELEQCGITATTIPYPPPFSEQPCETAPMPEQVTVLTYVPDTRQEFYGLPVILEAAKALPALSFVVMGGTGGGVDTPSNVTFEGFVADPGHLYDRASVVVRYVPHDGAGFSVAEALLHGRHVIYTLSSPHTQLVTWGVISELISKLSEFERLHDSGGIPPNLNGRDWARVEYDSDQRLGVLLRWLIRDQVQTEPALHDRHGSESTAEHVER